MRKIILLILFLCIIPITVALPQPTGFVNDFADILTPQEEQDLENLINALEQETTAEIAITKSELTMYCRVLELCFFFFI